MISQKHAVRRIHQIGGAMVRNFKAEVKEAKKEVKLAKKQGFDIEERPVVVTSTLPGSVYNKANNWIAFYSQFI